MNSWSNIPFVRILIPLIAGILLYRGGVALLPAYLIQYIVLTLVISLAAWLFFLPGLNTFKTRLIPGIVILVCVLLTGYLLAYHNDYRNRQDFVGHIDKSQPVEMVLLIDNAVEQKNNSLKTTATAIAYKKDSTWIPCQGKILLYISHRDSAQSLAFGDKIAATFWLSEIQEAVFNSDFNYKKYLSDKNIFHQAYIADGNYTVLEKKCGNPVTAFALNVRDQMVGILQNQLGKNDESGVVAAMLIGYRADISADMMKAYSEAGVIHIMSVSGLHVGVIYLMIMGIIGLLGWGKKKKWIQAMLVLSLIWLYSLITGMSAPVLRSAVMISFVAIGNLLNRTISPYNSLAAAAFVLLAINPGSLGEIGFQLSFVALLGILVFQRPLYLLWNVRNRWLDKIWQLACVSIAAQLATLPFILYYFGQFPVYFLISNIIVVPLSSLVLYAGMAAVVFSWIPFLGSLSAWVTLWLTKIMNGTVATIESLPSAVISNIYLSAWASIFLLFIIVLGFLMIYRHRIRLLYLILACGISATLFQWSYHNGNKRAQFAFVLKDGQHYLLGIKDASTLYVITPDSGEISGFVQNRLKKYAERNALSLVSVPGTFDNNIVFRQKAFVGWQRFRLMSWDEKKMPSAEISRLKLDVMLAPAISRYYFNTSEGPLPASQFLSRVPSSRSGMVNLNDKKDRILELKP